ncbi:MAG: FKBP-type peptidyl-prolyl cis-trans isomerase [Bacteroidales bacterium]|nr:FKBP-type peptidyl-prolyl cis-trans isomerase [Bacteroidales bacterium]
MKAIKFIAAAALALAMAAACNNAPKVDVELPTAAEVDSASYLIGINFGYFIKANGFGEDLNFAQIKKGMMDFIKSEGDMNDEGFNDQFKIAPTEMNRIFGQFIEKKSAYTAAVNKAEGEAFLAKNKLADGVEVKMVGESELQYKIIEEGNEVRAAAADTVWVNYKGTLIDGTVFDQNEGEPVKMMLNRVIKGWTEGLQLVGEGGKIQLFIPAELGYGERKSGKIEAGSTLIFDVEVTKIGKKPVEE